MLAAYGSGAALRSSEEGIRILNLDIGGGTTKLAIVEGGRVLATAAVHIGGRLVVSSMPMAASPVSIRPDARIAKRAGLDWTLGDIVDDAALDRVAETMADTLVQALVACPMPRRYRAPVPDRSAQRTRRHQGRDGLGRCRGIHLRP